MQMIMKSKSCVLVLIYGWKGLESLTKVVGRDKL